MLMKPQLHPLDRHRSAALRYLMHFWDPGL